jgi:hypothetical protein
MYICMYICTYIPNLVLVEEEKDMSESCSRFTLELRALPPNPSATESYNILYDVDLQFVPYELK